MEKNLLQKLKPYKFNHLILLDRVKNELNNGILTKPLLLHGVGGMGKTSTAIVCAKNASGYNLNTPSLENEPNIKLVNSSRGKEILKEIEVFLKVKSPFDFDKKPKTVIFEEFDTATHKTYEEFKTFFDDYSEYGNFIAICNDLEKVERESKGAVASRFKIINYNPINDLEQKELRLKYIERTKKVLNSSSINIKATDEIIECLVDKFLPDWRHIIYEIQTWKEQNISELTNVELTNTTNAFQNLYKLLLSKPDTVNIYKEVNQRYVEQSKQILNDLGTNFIDWLIVHHPQKALRIGQLLITINDHQYKHSFVFDPLVNLRACFYKLQQILNTK